MTMRCKPEIRLCREVLLTAITFVSLYTARTVVMESKISTNEYRSRMAFEAAEAGQEAALSFISGGRDRNGINGVSDEVVFDTTGDGTLDSNTLTLANGSKVTVTLTEASDKDVVATEVVAQGWSDDGTATRTITQLIANVPPIPNLPDSPLSTRGSVVVNGSATVINPEGHSTIWSGKDVSLGSNAATATRIADPNDLNYPDCLGGSVQCGTMPASDRYVAGIDVVESDTNLSNLTGDNFFYNFFGMQPQTYKDSRATVTVVGENIENAYTATPPGADLANGEIVWVDRRTDGSDVDANAIAVGTSADPSILIIVGDAVLRGNTTINGILFVTGNMTVRGNVTVTGAVIVAGDTVTDAGGSFTVNYNSSLIKRLGDDTPSSSGGGSWRDF